VAAAAIRPDWSGSPTDVRCSSRQQCPRRHRTTSQLRPTTRRQRRRRTPRSTVRAMRCWRRWTTTLPSRCWWPTHDSPTTTPRYSPCWRARRSTCTAVASQRRSRAARTEDGSRWAASRSCCLQDIRVPWPCGTARRSGERHSSRCSVTAPGPTAPSHCTRRWCGPCSETVPPTRTCRRGSRRSTWTNRPTVRSTPSRTSAWGSTSWCSSPGPTACAGANSARGPARPVGTSACRSPLPTALFAGDSGTGKTMAPR
jgi:hypothetical protein